MRELPDGRVGRFGWKADFATLREFTEDAMHGELGVEATDVGGGRMTPSAFEDLTFFVSELAPPPRHLIAQAEEEAGRAAFESFACDACHVPELATRDIAKPVPLFSDLLVHDVAPGNTRRLAGIPYAAALGIAATAPYFHDGAPATLDAAILRHEGEAARSRDAYAGASEADRAALLAFLGSL